jgi:predicted nuclease of predicted toxin-antitoxin system
VSKNDDFTSLLFLFGYPPKVILPALGNYQNLHVVEALEAAKDAIETTLAREDVGLVTVY